MLGDVLGDEKHYIFHCTNINLVEIREKLLDKLYKTSPEIVPKTESCFLRLTKLILSDKREMTWTTIGKFLSKLLNTTEEILRASNPGLQSGPPMRHKFNDNVHFRHAQVILRQIVYRCLNQYL